MMVWCNVYTYALVASARIFKMFCIVIYIQPRVFDFRCQRCVSDMRCATWEHVFKLPPEWPAGMVFRCRLLIASPLIFIEATQAPSMKIRVWNNIPVPLQAHAKGSVIFKPQKYCIFSVQGTLRAKFCWLKIEIWTRMDH